MNVISEIQRINDLELARGLTHTSASWHAKYSNSAWINIGSLPSNLTEGDVLCIFSQYGEIDDVHLVREAATGKSRGFAFVKYEDARSCVLAVDNLCGSKVLGRMLRVDHVERYRLPKHVQEREGNEMMMTETEGDEKKRNKNSVAEAGHAYEGQELATSYDIHSGQDLFAAPKIERDNDHNNQREGATTHGTEKNPVDNDKAERKRRKEERAQKRKEKEEHRRRKEERKRRKHGSAGSRSSTKDKRRHSRSRSCSK
jgi:RNA-binding motif X-linked protein 2